MSKIVRERSITVLSCSAGKTSNYSDLFGVVIAATPSPPHVVCLTGIRSDCYAAMVREFKSRGYGCHGSKECGIAILSRVPVWGTTSVGFSAGTEKVIIQEYHFPRDFAPPGANSGVSSGSHLGASEGLSSQKFEDVESIGEPSINLRFLVAKMSLDSVSRRSQISQLHALSGLAFGGDLHPPQGGTGVDATIFAGDTSLPGWQMGSGDVVPAAGWWDAWREMGTAGGEVTRSDTGDRPDRIWYAGMRCTRFETIPDHCPPTLAGETTDLGVTGECSAIFAEFVF